MPKTLNIRRDYAKILDNKRAIINLIIDFGHRSDYNLLC